jgi:hypothetical protein
MTKKAPPLKISDTDYGIMFWGPPGPESKDDGRDLTISTKSNHSMQFCESGNSSFVTPKCNTENVGANITESKDGKEAPAKQILAENGDIVFIAQNGNIRLKAKNIWIETSDEEPGGNFLVSSNGYISLASGEQTRIMGSKVCIRGECGVDIGGSDVIIKGKFSFGESPDAIGLVKSLLAGNWASILEAIDKSCK